MPKPISSGELDIPGVGAALAALADACRSHDIPFFLVGALARDILLHHLRGVERSPRLTRDIDIAVGVVSWHRFDRLRETLSIQHDFRAIRAPHRLESSEGLLVDIIPFGDVEDARHAVRWPPEMNFEMSVLGYEEALEMTEPVVVDGVAIRVVSLLAFGPLKLLAWNDRRLRTTRDAIDLCFVLKSYWEAETERILDHHADLFETEGGDNDLIGARAYGRDAAAYVKRSSELKDTVLAVLSRETSDIHDSKLAAEMGRACSVEYDRRFALLLRFRDGLSEALARDL